MHFEACESWDCFWGSRGMYVCVDEYTFVSSFLSRFICQQCTLPVFSVWLGKAVHEHFSMQKCQFTQTDQVLERIIRKLPCASVCVLHFRTVTSMGEWLWWVDIGWQPCTHKATCPFCYSSSTNRRRGENTMKGLWLKMRTRGSLRNYRHGQNRLNLGNSVYS